MLSEPSWKKQRHFLKLRENQLFKGFQEIGGVGVYEKGLFKREAKILSGKEIEKGKFETFSGGTYKQDVVFERT